MTRLARHGLYWLVIFLLAIPFVLLIVANWLYEMADVRVSRFHAWAWQEKYWRPTADV